jgi:hypothetical protein
MKNHEARKHLNLYYILKEDKENHALPHEKCSEMWLSVLKRLGLPPDPDTA